ncbi:acyltransferase [Arthrobacter sp. ov118]|uniref:acyltransferase n=1 Tax=Arthrobacter sp. ov118 TaxID=1761747 RepID=UPI0008EC9980|nr:acyltransferase family protein [Arthrobacter sp. ov118]SFT36633.1 Surface polysaccharide O-acyltransferase, integral membrane enzyme [Arthrobacter sp. ov118]
MTVLRARPEASAAVASPRDYSLDILRILSICGVVAIHLFGYVMGHSERGSRNWWLGAALDIPFIWVVPVFVMISGALLLAPQDRVLEPRSFYRKRAVRLLPALIVWHLVYLLGVRWLMRGEDLPPARAAQLLYDGAVFTQLYFLWLILGLYLVAPLITAFLQNGGPRRAQILAAALLAATALAFMAPGIAGSLGFARPISLNIFTHWLPYVGYFVAGRALRGVLLRGWSLFAAIVVAIGLAGLCLWQYGHQGQAGLLNVVSPVSYLSPTVMVLAVAVFLSARSIFSRITPAPAAGRMLVTISAASFGVFLVHLLVFEIIRLNVPAVFDGRSVVAAFASYAATLVLSFTIAVLASRIPFLRNIF